MVVLAPAGRLVRIHPPGGVFGFASAVVLEPEGQTTLERLGMAFGHELVAGSTALGLRALRGQQVTEAGRAPDQLARGGQLEALGNGLFGLLHGRSRPKQGAARCLARGKLALYNKLKPALVFRAKITSKNSEKGLTCPTR